MAGCPDRHRGQPVRREGKLNPTEGIMKSMHRPLAAVFLAWLFGAAGLLGSGTSGAADPAPPEKTVLAAASGTIRASERASETVVFGGQASISGKVIQDTDFGSPPVLEITLDLGNVKGKGLRTGKTYVVSSQITLRRPLRAFEPVDVSFTFAMDGEPLQARSATASFGIYYSAAKGMTTTPVQISPHLPG
jgi:hypothetical protein